jgi:hypothetical protein
MYAAPMRALVFTAILLAGCGGSQSAPPASPAPAATPPPAGSAVTGGSDAGGSATTTTTGPSVDSMIAKMGEFKDKLCACPDQQCVEGVSDEMTKWTHDLKQQGVKDPHLTDDQTKRAAEIGEALGKCMRRIQNMGG